MKNKLKQKTAMTHRAQGGVHALQTSAAADETLQVEQLVAGLLETFQLAKPPSRPGKPTKANESDLVVLLRAFGELQRRLKLLETENATLKSRVTSLELGKASGRDSESFAMKVASPGSNFSASVVQAMNANSKIA